MHTIIKSRPEHLWTVGFFKPNGQWEPDSDHDTHEEAVNHCARLNGANNLPVPTPVARNCERCTQLERELRRMRDAAIRAEVNLRSALADVDSSD